MIILLPLQVLLDKNIPVNNMNEIKSVLVSALASNGQMTDALNVYGEMGQVKANLEPKAVLSLIVSINAKSCFFLSSLYLLKTFELFSRNIFNLKGS